MKKIIASLLSFLVGCSGSRVNVPAQKDFDLQRYLGRWYEYARLDHFFERGMECVTADYALLDNGRVEVINRGYKTQKGEWKTSEGEAKIIDGKAGILKVYFFPLVGGDYKVAYIDEDYQIAVVSGGTTSYLWFLSREPKVTPEQSQLMHSIAAKMGYDTTKLLYPNMCSPETMGEHHKAANF